MNLFVAFVVQYKIKRCLKKECCKQCRHVKFKGTMTKWPNQMFTARCCNLAFSCGRTLLHLNITQYKSDNTVTNTSIQDNSSLKPLPHQSGVLTAFTQRSKNCRTPRCALCSRHQRCVRAVRTPLCSIT